MAYETFDVNAMIADHVKELRRDNWSNYQTWCTVRKAMFEGDYAYILNQYMLYNYGKSAWEALHTTPGGPKMELLEYSNALSDVIKRTMGVYNKPARRAILIDAETPKAKMIQGAMDAIDAAKPAPVEPIPVSAPPEDETEETPPADPAGQKPKPPPFPGAKPAMPGAPDPEAPKDDEPLDQEEDENFALLIKDVPYDEWMQQICWLTGVTGLVIARPCITEEMKLDVQILTPDEFTPITAWNDPSRLVGCFYELCYPDDSTKPVSRTFVWDMEGLYISSMYYAGVTLNKLDREAIKKEYAGMVVVDGNKVVEAESKIGSAYQYRDENDNPLLPFAVSRIDAPPGRLCNQWVGKDLYDATLRIGKILAEKAHLITNQSHKQFVIAGKAVDQIGGQVIGPANPLILPGEADQIKVDLMSLETEVQKLTDETREILQECLFRRGWSYDDFKMTAQPRTADAVYQSNEGKREYITRCQSFMRQVEHQFMRAIIAVANADWDPKAGKGGKITTEGETSVDFADPLQVNPFMAYDIIEKMIRQNLYSVLDFAMRINDDLTTRDEARDYILRNKRENKIGKTLGFGLLEMGAMLNPANPELGGENGPIPAGNQPPGTANAGDKPGYSGIKPGNQFGK